MARKLPWLASASEKAGDRSDRAPVSKRRRTTPSDENGEEDLDVGGKSQPRERKPRNNRNRSSSPPPAAPEEIFMRDGADADDGWRLVEDELWSSAGLFTRHLHHAEYQRLKQLARSRNEGTVQNITRPLDSVTALSTESREKPEGDKSKDRSRATVATFRGKAVDASDDEDDDPWLRDPRLAGLMSQKEKSSPLAKIAGVQSTSRAANGFAQGHPSPRKNRSYVYGQSIPRRDSSSNIQDNALGEYDSDDLDAPSYRDSGSHALRVSDRVHQKEVPRQDSSPSMDRVSRTQFPNHGDDDMDHDDMFDPFPMRTDRSRKVKQVVAAEPIRARDKEALKDKGALNPDEIPTFLV